MKFYKFQFSEKNDKGFVTVKHGYFATVEVFGYWIDIWNTRGGRTGHCYSIEYEDEKYNRMNVNADCDPVDHSPIDEHRIAYCECSQHGYVVIKGF